MARTKFNVDKDVEKRTCDGIVFDSKLEKNYYEEVLKPLVASGEVVSYELQKPYELQPKFEHNGASVRPVTYVADFFMVFKDGRELLVDTKGCPDSIALLKRKLFWYKYPDVDYQWITWVKKFGGWISYDECKRLRNEEKKLKKAKKEEEENV